MKIIKVKCSFIIPVEVPDDEEDGYDAVFDIEENHCPGTGRVGSAIEDFIKKSDEDGNCWGCALRGTNEIVFDPQYEEEVVPKLTQGLSPSA